jgi:hypothetical protein
MRESRARRGVVRGLVLIGRGILWSASHLSSSPHDRQAMRIISRVATFVGTDEGLAQRHETRPIEPIQA